jgi:hypothetical protein
MTVPLRSAAITISSASTSSDHETATPGSPREITYPWGIGSAWNGRCAGDELVHAWMDEAEVPSEPTNPFQVPTMHVTNWPAMQWNEFVIEFIKAHPTDDLWMDELAIDSKRIGCRR